MSALSPARILVVEDNDTLRRGIARALRERWTVVEEASAGDEALACIRSGEAFDVILSDVSLPGADGVAVLRAARERDVRTSVLLMTAYGSESVAVEAFRLGVRDYIIKPFTTGQVIEVLERTLTETRLRREKAELTRSLQRRGMAARAPNPVPRAA